MSYIVHQDETRDMGGKLETCEVSNVSTDVIPPKKPRTSRAKPKVSTTDPDAPVAKVRAPRKKKEVEAKVEIVAESKAPQDFQDTGNVKLDPTGLTPVALVRESVLISAEPTSSKKPRGRPPVDKWATVEARIRGGEFASDLSEIPSKAKLAIYISRVLAEDNAFRPRMKDLLTELGHADLLSVFALR